MTTNATTTDDLITPDLHAADALNLAKNEGEGVCMLFAPRPDPR